MAGAVEVVLAPAQFDDGVVLVEAELLHDEARQLLVAAQAVEGHEERGAVTSAAQVIARRCEQ